MLHFAKEQSALSIEVGADLFDTNCRPCHGAKGEGTPGLCPPLNDKHFFTDRLKEVGWSGSLEDYIVATVSSGRLVSTRPDQYPGGGKPAMPSWSDRFGGPLRDDQIRNIAAFIMNWEATAGEVTTSTVTVQGVGTDITVKLPAGDAQRGNQLAQSKGCAACHITTAVGPAWAKTGDQPGIGDRAATRIKDPSYTGKATTPEQYLFESIVTPHVYLVPPFGPIMPDTFGQTLSAQDVADLIAYMLTIK
jgi:mono/diheme cytochrome c family protein